METSHFIGTSAYFFVAGIIYQQTINLNNVNLDGKSTGKLFMFLGSIIWPITIVIQIISGKKK